MVDIRLGACAKVLSGKVVKYPIVPHIRSSKGTRWYAEGSTHGVRICLERETIGAGSSLPRWVPHFV